MKKFTQTDRKIGFLSITTFIATGYVDKKIFKKNGQKACPERSRMGSNFTF
jgi:hypothetical protein